jgi:hypothetical protein
MDISLLQSSVVGEEASACQAAWSRLEAYRRVLKSDANPGELISRSNWTYIVAR